MARTIAKDHDQKRLNILEVAAEVFAREGISRSSMNDVAKHGGISKATIYHYYKSKDELIHDILDNYLSQLRDRICQINLLGLSPEEQLNTIAAEFLLAYEGMDNQHKIQNEGLPLLPDEQQTILKRYQHDMVNVVQEILLQGFPEQLGNDRTQLKFTTMSVFGMLNWFYMWHPNANADQRREYAKTISTMAFHGVEGLEKTR